MATRLLERRLGQSRSARGLRPRLQAHRRLLATEHGQEEEKRDDSKRRLRAEEAAAEELATPAAEHVGRYNDLPLPQRFPWLHWGFRDRLEVQSWCLPNAQKVASAQIKIALGSSLGSVEAQLEAREATVGEFKEGAVFAYRQAAELFSAPIGTPRDIIAEAEAALGIEGEDSTAAAADGDGEAFNGAEGMFDEFVLRALREQRKTYAALRWQPTVTTRYVRATPLSIVVGPTQQLECGDGYRADGSRPALWAQKLQHFAALFSGMWAAFRGSGAGEGGVGFALLCDCHIEVEEDFELVDLETGEVVAAESGSRDHIWTFMAPIASVADTELEWTLRDMNHFVSMGGVVSSDTVRKLSPPD